MNRRFFRWVAGRGLTEEGTLPDVLGILEADEAARSAPCLALLPPLWDHHGHVAPLGASLEQADLKGCATPGEAVERTAEIAAGVPPGEWIEGFGWDQTLWGGEFPDKSELDARFPGRPVFLQRIDGHTAWVNSRALALAGLGEKSPDPEGGRLLRREGKPTGIVLDRAMERIQRSIPPPSLTTLKRRMTAALALLKEAGLSGVTDMGLEGSHAQTLQALDEEGSMPIHVAGHLWVGKDGHLPEVPKGGRRFKVVGAKFFADGALGSRGAALWQDYADAPGERGLLLWDAPSLAKAMGETSRRGLAAAVHAIGDRAVSLVLDAMEIMGSGRGHRIEHAQVLRPFDARRMARLGVTVSLQPCHYLSDRGWIKERLGERAKGAYPLGSLARLGIPLLLGTDFPIETPDPRRNLLAAMERNEEERLSLHEVLEACAPPKPFSTLTGGGTLAALETPPAEDGSWLRSARFIPLPPRNAPP